MASNEISREELKQAIEKFKEIRDAVIRLFNQMKTAISRLVEWAMGKLEERKRYQQSMVKHPSFSIPAVPSIKMKSQVLDNKPFCICVRSSCKN